MATHAARVTAFELTDFGDVGAGGLAAYDEEYGGGGLGDGGGGRSKLCERVEAGLAKP